MNKLIAVLVLFATSTSYAVFPFDIPTAKESTKIVIETRQEALRQETLELCNKVTKAIVERSNKGLIYAKVSVWGYSTQTERTVEKLLKARGYRVSMGYPFELFIVWR